MRFYNNNSFTAPDDLDAHMNPGGGEPFGVISLGHSDLCLDTIEDARAVLAAAAKIVAWFDAKPETHAFESAAGTAHGPCLHCGHLKSNRQHAAAEAKRLPDPPARTDAPRLLGDPICAAEHPSGVVCTEAPGHGDADHIAKDVWGGVVHRWPAVADDGQPPFAAVPRLTRVKRPADDGQTYSDVTK